MFWLESYGCVALGVGSEGRSIELVTGAGTACVPCAPKSNGASIGIGVDVGTSSSEGGSPHASDATIDTAEATPVEKNHFEDSVLNVPPDLDTRAVSDRSISTG